LFPHHTIYIDCQTAAFSVSIFISSENNQQLQTIHAPRPGLCLESRKGDITSDELVRYLKQKYYFFLDEAGDHGLAYVEPNFPLFLLSG